MFFGLYEFLILVVSTALLILGTRLFGNRQSGGAYSRTANPVLGPRAASLRAEQSGGLRRREIGERTVIIRTYSPRQICIRFMRWLRPFPFLRLRRRYPTRCAKRAK